jgi:hypothetical protein
MKLVYAVAASSLSILAFSPAQALTMPECSAKYKAAQTAGTLNGQKWNDFRKAECGDAAKPAAATTAAPAAAEAKPAEAKPSDVKPSDVKPSDVKPAAAAKPATPAPVATGPATFPTAIDPKYAKETPGKARLHTCVDMYNANKSGTGNGGLKWIQKGGGYYSECTKRLKGGTV